MSALEGSVTRPVIEALVDWARRIGEHRTTARAPVKARAFQSTINHGLERRFRMSKKYAPRRCAEVYHHAPAVDNSRISPTAPQLFSTSSGTRMNCDGFRDDASEE